MLAGNIKGDMNILECSNGAYKVYETIHGKSKTAKCRFDIKAIDVI